MNELLIFWSLLLDTGQEGEAVNIGIADPIFMMEWDD